MGENLTYNNNVILHNRIKCNKCGDVIESYDVHDFKWCKCKTVFVDGGHEYLRRGFKESHNDFTDMSETVQINSHGVNANIMYHMIPDDVMRALKFELLPSKSPVEWHRRYILKSPKKIDKNIDISLNISIPLDYNLDELDIAVIDEEYLQPYDYQYLIEDAERKNIENKVAIAVRDEVEEIIAMLQNAGLLSGHKRGDYI